VFLKVVPSNGISHIWKSKTIIAFIIGDFLHSG
jgi:hypothetical protein